MVRSRFTVASDAEAAVEIDPRRLTRDHLTALREIGFNRVSIGVQDNNPAVQKAVHRIQPYALTKTVVDWVRELGFSSLNIDLIYGLPYQTTASFNKTLDEVLELRPDRFAVFNYAHVPWLKPAQRILIEAALPSPRTKLELLKLTVQKLTSAGYVYIGMDHFARADDELAVAQRQKSLQRNFQGYSTRGGADIYAFGMSSISQADGFYWQNLKELPRYYAALDEGNLPLAKGYVLTVDDYIRRQTIMRLMCDLELDYAAMSRLLGLDFTEYFARELNSLDDLEGDGLVLKTPTGLIVTDFGRLLIRNIAMRFDAYLTMRETSRFFENNMKSVAIIGGGITGLTAAFRLQQKNIPVTLYEASNRVGGVIQSLRHDGYLAEFGPNTLLETSPKVSAFIDDLGLSLTAALLGPNGKNRYVVRGKRLIKMPESLPGFIATPLLRRWQSCVCCSIHSFSATISHAKRVWRSSLNGDPAEFPRSCC